MIVSSSLEKTYLIAVSFFQLGLLLVFLCNAGLPFPENVVVEEECEHINVTWEVSVDKDLSKWKGGEDYYMGV